jgi:hypothetical protein
MMRSGLRILRAVVALPLLAICTVTAAQDIAGIREIAPPSFSPPFVRSGIAVLLLVLLLFLLHKRRHRIQPPPSDREVPPGDTAALLAQLAESVRIGQCTNDQAITQLDELLRERFESCAGLPACRSTTQELNDITRHCDWLDSEVHSRLSRFLALSDRVKFSAYQPDHDDVATALQTVRILLDRIPSSQSA